MDSLLSGSHSAYVRFCFLRRLSGAAVFVALWLISGMAIGQVDAWNGKRVADAVCAQCHGKGTNGAPKIGDVNAWKSRAAQGLTALSQHAIQGLRKMPAHGGNPGLSDIEIKWAITYMVNQSGGNWVEPVDDAKVSRERTGEQIVTLQCIKCHETGVGGAPKIGDVTAWAQRFSRGTDLMVRSAIHGHGGMPARGGMVDLTDSELRSAALYMFLKGVVRADEPPVVKVQTDNRNHKIVDGLDIYLGVVSADSIRARQLAGDKQGIVAEDIPQGTRYFYINISLFARETGKPVTNAAIGLTVQDPLTAQKKKLSETTFNGIASYGNYFSMPENYNYKITAVINLPGQTEAVRTSFDYRPQ